VADIVADGYDAVYAAWDSPTFHALWAHEAVDDDVAAGFEHLNFAGVRQLDRLASALHRPKHGRLLDLACGAGGPGCWIARQKSLSLFGIDLSSVGALRAATRADELGIDATFVVGSVAALPLADATVTDCMSLDSLQYVADKRAAFAEVRRVLVPGGRFAFTVFEVDPARVVGLPVLGVDPIPDYAPLLQGLGFRVKDYQQTPGWQEHLERAYSAVIAAQSRLHDEMGEAALTSMVLEMTMTLAAQPYCGRAFVVAERA
jgi:ubiquinone/menaquinone biosynthesis C-methylase UbiE